MPNFLIDYEHKVLKEALTVPAMSETTRPDLNVPRDSILVNIASSSKFRKARSAVNPESAFVRAVGIEEDEVKLGHTYPDNSCAFHAYLDVLDIKPSHAPSLINLGTLYYNARFFEKARDCYILATQVDPNYTLAFFDLGNVYDELRDLPTAIKYYLHAVKLSPGYADARYNLSLAYERSGQSIKALKHWQVYCRLDPAGPWHNHARQQVRRILNNSPLRLVTPESELEMTQAILRRIYSRGRTVPRSYRDSVEQLWLKLGWF